jgi:hypothetical protein
MTEINELVAPPAPHSPGDDEACPFCPAPKPEDFTTHPGARNNSSILEAIMADPGCLVSKQSGARPKDGNEHRQRPSAAKPKPDPIFRHQKWGAYSAEAHHLISGNQALKGHPIENWIKGGSRIKKDTGYSVNNSDNGEWLPSIPEGHKGGAWSPLSLEEKVEIASEPMRRGKGQFHKGPHNVADTEDLLGAHVTYPDEVKRLLSVLDDVIYDWAAVCPICEPVDSDEGPFDPNWRVHDMFDALSRGIGTDLKGPPGHWKYFISRVALKFHQTVCEHKPR